MAIDTPVSLDRLHSSADAALGHAPTLQPIAASAESISTTPVSADQVVAAMQQLQQAISSGPNPDFTLDYLSGLSVVTVRSATTGQVVFQLPDSRALELARMIKDGASLGSLGFFETKA